MSKLAGLRILVIEDEALLSMLAEDALLDAGAAVLGPAVTVAEALALLQEEQTAPDAAILDLNLNGEMSAVVAEALATRGVPFVVTTGYNDSDIPWEHANLPVLTRPFAPEALTEVIGRLCASA